MKRLNKANRWILAATAISVFSFTACAKKKEKKKTTQVSLNALAIGNEVTLAPPVMGSSTAESLKALKYMISGISLCETLTINGTGFSNAENCSTLYSADLPGDLADSTLKVEQSVIDAMQAGEYANYQINLMDPESRAKLNVNAQASAGTYNYAVITWASPIQFNVEIDVNGTKIYSKPTTSIDGSQSTTTSDVREAPAQDGVVASPNGGTFFKLSKPFVISEDDVENQVAYVVDLVFNPEDVIRGSTDPDSLSMSSWFKGTTGGFYVPMLSLAPVPRKASDTNTKEIYKVTDTEGVIRRVELYYNTSDAEKTILGASIVDLNSLMSDDAKILSIETVDGKLDFTSVGTEGPGTGAAGLLKGFERGETCSATQIMKTNVTNCELLSTIVVE